MRNFITAMALMFTALSPAAAESPNGAENSACKTWVRLTERACAIR
jgi:hypothetical protein